jgi:hypothetical protein
MVVFFQTARADDRLGGVREHRVKVEAHEVAWPVAWACDVRWSELAAVSLAHL